MSEQETTNKRKDHNALGSPVPDENELSNWWGWYQYRKSPVDFLTLMMPPIGCKLKHTPKETKPEVSR